MNYSSQLQREIHNRYYIYSTDNSLEILPIFSSAKLSRVLKFAERIKSHFCELRILRGLQNEIFIGREDKIVWRYNNSRKSKGNGYLLAKRLTKKLRVKSAFSEFDWQYDKFNSRRKSSYYFGMTEVEFEKAKSLNYERSRIRQEVCNFKTRTQLLNKQLEIFKDATAGKCGANNYDEWSIHYYPNKDGGMNVWRAGRGHIETIINPIIVSILKRRYQKQLSEVKSLYAQYGNLEEDGKTIVIKGNNFYYAFGRNAEDLCSRRAKVIMNLDGIEYAAFPISSTHLILHPESDNRWKLNFKIINHSK